MKRAVVPVSGGMDSVVLLWKALAEFDEVYALTFRYNQRHDREIDCAISQCIRASKQNRLKGILKDWKVLDTGFISQLTTDSSLTNTDIDNPNVRTVRGEAQPASYVPFGDIKLTAKSISEDCFSMVRPTFLTSSGNSAIA